MRLRKASTFALCSYSNMSRKLAAHKLAAVQLAQAHSYTFAAPAHRLLAVGRIQRTEVPTDARFDIFHASLQFRAGEIAIPIIDSLERASVYGDKGLNNTYLK